jgi:CDP-4-dehydro-6-deoxyglucose reductase
LLLTRETSQTRGVHEDQIVTFWRATGAREGREFMPEVTILPDGLQVTAAEAETVLAALSRAGLKYRVGCKRGGCGVCKVQLLLGEVRYERPIADSVLSDDQRVAGICLSCRAVPITNIAIELQEGDRLRKVLGFAFFASAPIPSGPSAPSPTTRNDRKETIT